MKYRLPSWKKQQKKKKINRIKRVARTVVFFVLLVFLLSIFIIFLLAKRNSFWDAKSHLNVVINSSPLLVLSINPPRNFYLTSLDENLYVEVGDLGFYRLGKVFELGELKGEGSGLLRRTIQKELGVPIDVVINFDDAKVDFSLENSAALKSFLGKKVENATIKAGGNDLVKWDFFSIYFSGLIDKLVLVEFKAFKKGSLPDGQEVDIIDQTKLFKFRDYFLDEKIVDDGLSIVVWNSTEKKGLGKQTADILTSMGLKVVDVSSTDLKIESKNCLLMANAEVSKTHSFKRTRLIFECDSEETIDEEIRADMVLIMGGD